MGRSEERREGRRGRNHDAEADRDKLKELRRIADRIAPVPQQFRIYNGTVQNITTFGCFVSLNDFKKKTEGLVHISQLRREGRVNKVEEVVSKNQQVKVKILTITGQKISLSMKDVDQETGEDLNPTANQVATGGNREAVADQLRNPERPHNAS